MLVDSGLCINTYSEEEAHTRQLVIVTGRHVVSDGGQEQLRIEPILELPTIIGLTHLSNQCIQVFLVESIIACSVNSILGGSIETAAANGTIIYQEELKEAATQLCITLAKEFIFALPCQPLDSVIQEAIDVMSNGGLFKRTEIAALTNRQRSLSLMDDEDDEQYNDIELEVSKSKGSISQLAFLQNILEPYIEAYWLTGSQLLELKDAVYKECEFVEMMKQCLLDRSEKGLTYFVESCCMEMTRNAIRRYCEMNMIKMDGVEARSRTIQIISRDQMIELVNDLDSYRR